VALKIDALSMYGKLLQAFEDMVLPFCKPVLEFIVAQLGLHAKLFSGQSPLDPFEAMVLRELYAELISQSVDVCCSMVLVSPDALAQHAGPLFEHSCEAFKVVNDINCKYEIVELVAQMCLLGLKSGEEQTAEEDFLDFEMRKIQALDELQQEHASSNSASSSSATQTPAKLELDKPLWDGKGLKFTTLFSALEECVKLFEEEEYEDDIGEEEDGEDAESGDEDGEESSASDASMASFEPHHTKSLSGSKQTSSGQGSSQNDKDGQDNGANKRRQEESGAGTVIALLSGLSYTHFSESEHESCYKKVYSALLSKINKAFSKPDTYSKLPAMIDCLGQLLSNSSPALVRADYQNLTQLLENIMKTVRIWKSEDPSPFNRRAYGAIRAELVTAYAALLKADPISTLAQADHFMTAVTFLLADPSILADFAGSLVSIEASKKQEALAKLESGLLFKIIDSYLKELANPSASVSMKKVVMQSLGNLARQVGIIFVKMLEITIPVLLFLGRDVPDLAPAAITAVAQILFAIRGDAEAAKTYVQKSIDQAIAMVLQDILMSGFEVSTSTSKSVGAASEIVFNFSTKSRLDEDGEAEEDEEDEEMMAEDNIADLVYKGECFLAYVLHVPELLSIIGSIDNEVYFERIFSTLVEIEEKPSLFEEDSMLKMTAVDILTFMVEHIKQTHTKAHQQRALKAFQEADVPAFEEELEKSVARLEALNLK
jgi:hypothetical protein